MVGAKDAGPGVEGFLEEWDGFVEPACFLVSIGEVVAARKGVGVVGSEDLGSGCEEFV